MSRYIDDRTYHAARADDELRRAEEATDPAVIAVHRELAALHRRKMIEVVATPANGISRFVTRLSPERAS